MLRRLRLSVFLPFTGILTLVLSVASPIAAAQSGSFTVSQNGHSVGTASFRYAGTPNGYDSTAVVKVAMQGLDYALSKTEKLDREDHLRHVQLSATVSGAAVNVTGTHDAAQFLLNISSNGRSNTTRLAEHDAAV